MTDVPDVAPQAHAGLDPAAGPVEIPWDELSPEALQGVVESFVLREGTEYGATEVPLAHKVEQVLRQLRRGEARVLFDPSTESIDIRAVSGTLRSRPIG